MAECIKCEISFDYGKKFCKNCGSSLVESKDILNEAKSFFEAKRIDEALKELEKIPYFSFFRDSAVFYKIKIFYENEEYAKVEQLIITTGNSQTEKPRYKNLTNEDKQELANILLRIGANYAENGEMDKSIYFLKDAEELSPENSKEKLGEVYFTIGRYYYDKNDFNKAIKVLVKSKDFKNKEAKIILAKIYYNKAQKNFNAGNIKEALELTKKTMILHPEEKTYPELFKKIKEIKKEKQNKIMKVILSSVSVFLLAALISIAFNNLFKSETEKTQIKFSKQDVRKRVNEYLESNMLSSVNYVTSLYSNNVDFYKSGIVDKEFIKNDKRKYFSKWSIRKITLTSNIDIKIDSVNKKWLTKFNYHYQIHNSKRRLQGDAWCELVFEENNDKLVIISEKGGIKSKGENSVIKIGNQLWMRNNLNVTHFRNGDKIPKATSSYEWINAAKNREPVWCYYENDKKNKNSKLYNWFAVNDPRGLAPRGFHIPTIDELRELANNTDYNNANNFSTFSQNIYGAGVCSKYDTEFSIMAIIWSSTSDYSLAYSMAIAPKVHEDNSWDIWFPTDNKCNGHYVRCIKNSY